MRILSDDDEEIVAGDLVAIVFAENEPPLLLIPDKEGHEDAPEHTIAGAAVFHYMAEDDNLETMINRMKDQVMYNRAKQTRQ